MIKDKPYWKKRNKQTPSMYRQYAYHDDGTKAFDEKGEHIFREIPNRALKRRWHAEIRRKNKHA